MRNAALGVLRQKRVDNIAAELRAYAWQPVETLLRLLGLSLPDN